MGNSVEKSLLIVGAGAYAKIAAEIASDMGCFAKIGFVDDKVTESPCGIPVAGTTRDIDRLAGEYSHIVVAIGDPQVRLTIIDKLLKTTSYCVPSLISPKAYVSASAKLMEGCFVEPMAVVHTDCTLGRGCIVSAGAVMNHTSTCGNGVHLDCNATVPGYARVPDGTKVPSGTVYKNA